MSEKRFIVKSEKIGRFHNIFVQTDKIEYLLTGDFDNDNEMIREIVYLLNEQQATIQYLTIEKHQADKRFQTIIAELKKDNEQLRKELDNFKPVMFQDIRKGTVILYSKGD